MLFVHELLFLEKSVYKYDDFEVEHKKCSVLDLEKKLPNIKTKNNSLCTKVPSPLSLKNHGVYNIKVFSSCTKILYP